MAWTVTAGEVVNDAAVEVGLADSADPFASTDANVVQLCRLLKSCGRELVMARNWTYLRKEHTFTTVQGTSNYSLPTDFFRMYDQSGWNRTNRLPLGGPLSPQEWQFLKARLVGVVFTVLFRPMNGEMNLYPDTNTPGGYSIAFEYGSKYWLSSDATPTVLSKDAPTASTDVVWFDPLLITRSLKLAFLKAKGLDTTGAEQDYAASLNAAMGADAPNKVLNLHRGPMDPSAVLIGGQSVPITGFGV
jgi:hypothetical protein